MNVLVVEDNWQAANTIVSVVKELNHQVLLVQDGIQAMKRIDEAFPDLLIVSLDSAAFDGFEIVRLLRQNRNISTLIIAVVLKPDETFVMQGYKFNVDCYLTRPFRKEEARAFIERVLETLEDP